MKLVSPCHEKYAAMPKQGEGRYCRSCEKVVIDFSGMSPEQIKMYFENNRGREICGFSRKGQTGEGNIFENRLFLFREFVRVKVKLSPLRTAVLGLISGLIVFTSSCIGKRSGTIPAFQDRYNLEKDSIKKN